MRCGAWRMSAKGQDATEAADIARVGFAPQVVIRVTADGRRGLRAEMPAGPVGRLMKLPFAQRNRGPPIARCSLFAQVGLRQVIRSAAPIGLGFGGASDADRPVFWAAK